MDDDSSDDDDDDDDYHIPHNWSGYDFSKLRVNEGEAVSWEYRQNEVCIGSVYANSGNMKEAIKRWSPYLCKDSSKWSRAVREHMTCVVCEANALSGCTLQRKSGRTSGRSEK